MGDESSNYDVNIRTTGDPAGVKQIDSELDKLDQKAQSVNLAPKATAAAVGPETAISEAALEARQTREERISSLIAQRQILVDLELEKTQALAAGGTARAAAIGEEIAQRRLALQLQTTAALTERESVVIAKQLLAAEAQVTFEKKLQAIAATASNESNILAGVSLSRARNEAFTLTRELGTGASTTRTISALLGSLGPQIGVASFAAFLLYEHFDKIQGAIQGITNALAGVDSSLGEEIKKAHEFEIALRDAGKKSVAELQSNLGKLNDEITLLHDDYVKAILDGDDKLAVSLQKQLTAKTQLRDIYAAEEQYARDLAILEEQRTAELERQANLRKGEIAAQTEVTRLEKEFNQTRNEGLSATGKLDLYRQKVEDIQHQLRNLGVDASSPNEAYTKSIGLEEQQHAAVLKLAIDWQKITAEQGKINKALDDERNKIAQTNAGSLADKIRLLREAQKLGSTTAGPKADALEGKNKVGPAYFQDVLAKNPNDINAQLQVARFRENAADAITVAKQTAEQASQAISQVQKAYGPVATAIDKIPGAVNEGVGKIVTSVNTATGNLRSDFQRQIDKINLRVGALEKRD